MLRLLLLLGALFLQHSDAQIKDIWSRKGYFDFQEYQYEIDELQDEMNAPCWTRCFKLDDTPRFNHLKPAYNDIFRAGHEAMRLALMYSVNGTAYLFDSTLSSYHSYSSALKPEERGTKIFNFQKNLAKIVVSMLGHDYDVNPAYAIQFDGEKAWTCSQWSCKDRCNMVEALGYLECIDTSADSYHDNKIEPACRMADDMMHSNDIGYCSWYLENEMAIAFVNSDFDHNVLRVQHDHGHHHANHYSACQSHFKTRLVIGTHAVDEHEMDDWQSPDAHYLYIRDNAYTMEAAEKLASCMRASCCDPDSDFTYSLGDCWSMTEDYSMEKTEYEVQHHIRGELLD